MSLTLYRNPITSLPSSSLTSVSSPSAPSSLFLSSYYPSRFSLLKRVLKLILLWSPSILTAPIASIWPYFRHHAWDPLVLKTLRSSGPTFIKLGQWASTRPDIFPPHLCSLLTNLQHDAPPHSFHDTKAIIESEFFPKKLTDLFAHFDPHPIASGSIAQVHKAIAHGGLECAVKVRHPHTPQLMATDLFLIQFFANRLEKWFPSLQWISPSEAASEFARLVWSQVDLRDEENHLFRFRHNFKSKEDKLITFPMPIRDLCSEAVLTETYEPGVHVSQYLPMNYNTTSENTTQLPIIRKRIAEIGMRAFMEMMFRDNFVHGDLHSGNILIKLKSKYDNQLNAFGVTGLWNRAKLMFGIPVKASVSPAPQLSLIPDVQEDRDVSLVFIDAGVVCQLSPRDHANFRALFGAVASAQGKQGARLMIENATRVSNTLNITQFENEMDALFNKARSQNFSEIQIGSVLRGVLDICRKHGVKLETSFVSLVTAIGIVEGLGRQLRPDINLVSEAAPFLIKYSLKNPLPID